MRLPQELFAEALWLEWDIHYGIIHKERLPDLLRRYNLKLKKEKTLDDIQLAFSRGLKDTFCNTAKQIEKIAEEIDKICIIANWEDAVEKYKIWWNDDLLVWKRGRYYECYKRFREVEADSKEEAEETIINEIGRGIENAPEQIYDSGAEAWRIKMYD